MATAVTGPPFGRTVAGNRWDLAVDDPTPHRSVSVVVTHFEQPTQLARTLTGLRRQTRPPEQIVVADDGSAQPPTCGADVAVVTQPDRGFRAAAARNLGAAQCVGDLLVFLDADTTPEPDFLERIVRLPGRLPELLAVGRRRHADLAAAGPQAPVECSGPGRELTEPGWLRRAYAETADLLHADATSHRFVMSAALACSRWWFEQLGGFDERFVGYGGEDWELAARSWRRGGLVAHAADAVAWHDGPAVGEQGRGADTAERSPLDQTLAVAERVGAPGATYTGLLLGPPDLVVTADAALGRRGLTITLDSLLAGLPRARILLPPAAATWFAGDPRVATGATAPGDLLAADDRVHLHLTSPAIGAPGAWAALVAQADGVDPPATVVLERSDGQQLGLLHDLRQHRRAARWPASAPGLITTAVHRSDLRSAQETSLQAWLEGWA